MRDDQMGGRAGGGGPYLELINHVPVVDVVGITSIHNVGDRHDHSVDCVPSCLEMVHADVVLDRLHGVDQGQLGLDESPELLLGLERQSVQGTQVLVDDDHLWLHHRLLDDDIPLLL